MLNEPDTDLLILVGQVEACAAVVVESLDLKCITKMNSK